MRRSAGLGDSVTALSRTRTDGAGLPRKPEVFAEILTRDPGMIGLCQQAEAIADSRQPVLITGETGTGKELFARGLHQASGLPGEFVAVNIAGLDDNVFSDTLFGHLRGAFTGAERMRPGMVGKAANGTLFLDEIGDLSQSSQVKLLRLLQEGEFLPLGADDPRRSSARIISATNQDLWAFQRTGRFRADLNFRLRVHHFHLPPLRERRRDIPLLVEHFLIQAAKAFNRKPPSLPGALERLLDDYPFPGNIRELQAMLYDAVGRHQGRVLSLRSFHQHISRHHSRQGERLPEQRLGRVQPKDGSFPTIQEAVRLLVLEAMREAGGNQALAARMLGISRQALNKRLKKMVGARERGGGGTDSGLGGRLG